MTGARIVIVWFIGIVALVVAGLGARAEEPFKLLDEKQIRARVVGKGITDGPHWSMSGTNIRMRSNGDQEAVSSIVMAHRAADRQEPLKFVQICRTVETLQCENLSSHYPRWPFFLPQTVRHRPSPARTAPSNRRLA